MRQPDRRVVLAGLAAASLTAASQGAIGATSSPKPFPLPEELESGDLLWPKIPGVFVPYRYVGARDAQADEAEWDARRDELIARMEAHLTMDNVGAYNLLREMTYAEFRARYLHGQPPGGFVTYSFANIAAVGHIGIVFRESGAAPPRVIEAVYPDGVAEITYDEWTRFRPNEIAWHGRIADKTAQERASFAAEAATYVGKPYDFWNFRLDDDTAFYCSKLVWLAAIKALSLAIDGDSNPKRLFWLSPKQILNAPTIAVLLDQGNYGFD